MTTHNNNNIIENAQNNDISTERMMDQPTDTVSWIEWMPNNEQTFAVSCWDGKILVYQITMSQYRSQLQLVFMYQFQEPALRISWKDDGGMLFASVLDNKVYGIVLQSQQVMEIGIHNDMISGVHWISYFQMVMSLSYDKTIKFWSLQGTLQFQIQLDYRCLFSVLKNNVIAVALGEEKIYILNIQNLQNQANQKIIYQDSPLGQKSDLTCIELNENGDKIALGSVDGRANLSRIIQDYQKCYSLQQILTFKCQKTEENNGKNQTVYPLNDIGFNIRSNEFVFTCGSDGTINYWDYEQKNKIQTFNVKNIPVCRAKISSQGRYLAYAIGNDWHKGVWGLESLQKSQIFVHQITDSELKYKKSAW